MALQFAVKVSNARLDAIETSVGASPTLRIRSGAPPANNSSTDTGDVLSTMTLPADWLTSADARKISKTGTWQDASADADGTAGHFRIYESSTDAPCAIQGTAGVAGDSPDLVLDYKVFKTGVEFTITKFDITDGNA